MARPLEAALVLMLSACGGSADPAGSDVGPPAVTPTPSSSDTGTPSEDEDTVVESGPGLTPWALAFDGLAQQLMGGVDLAVADDGTVLTTWVDGRGGRAHVRLTRSTDGGVTFEPSLKVSGDDVRPYSADWGAPHVVVVGDRVAVVGAAEHGTSSSAYSWSASLSDLAFDPGVVWGHGLVELAAGALSPSGELWVAWLDYGDDDVTVMLGNPTLGTDGVPIDDPLGSPACECCPPHLLFTSEGAPVVGWRDNADNIRNMAVATGEPGATTVDTVVRATSTDWEIDACPVQGPRLAELADGRLILAWADGSSGAYLVLVVDSADGVTWSGARVVAPDLPAPQVSPRVVVGPSGRVYLVLGSRGTYWLATSDDAGATWAAPTPMGVPGVGPIVEVELEATPAGVWAAGGTGEGVWVRQLE